MRRPHVITDRGDRTIMFRGWRTHKLVLEAGLKPIWLGTVQAWVLDASKLPNLVAFAEHRNELIAIEGGEGPRDVVRETDAPEGLEDAQLDLFGGVA